MAAALTGAAEASEATKAPPPRATVAASAMMSFLIMASLLDFIWRTSMTTMIDAH